MTTSPQENLMTWLRDAYAMERHQAIEFTERIAALVPTLTQQYFDREAAR